ncbi:MAG: hypothetical protein ABIJ81_01760 [Patescibacteria group bacterium]
MLSTILAIAIGLFFIFALGTLAYASFSAAPWVPLFKRDIMRMIALARVKPDDVIYDIGCGDGRVLIQVVKLTGAKAIGFEISLIPYLIALLRVRLAGLASKIDIKYQNFYLADFSQANIIISFLTPMAMKKLEPKIKKELGSTARFLSYAFPLPNIKPKLVDKPHEKLAKIFLY